MKNTDFKIIAIDGGAASGKSSTSKGVSKALNYMHVDTGSHYRSITLALINAGISPGDKADIIMSTKALTLETEISGVSANLKVNGSVPDDAAIRSPEVNGNVSLFAAIPEIRASLLDYQKKQAQVAQEKGFNGLIMEGRDICSVIFPKANLKVFLHADEEARRLRRANDGLQDSIAKRDEIDSKRKIAPLIYTEDSVKIDTGLLSLQEVIDKVCELATS